MTALAGRGLDVYLAGLGESASLAWAGSRCPMEYDGGLAWVG